jgi:hypothetical protein
MKPARVGLIAPVLVSDATSFAIVGLTPRQFRAFVREHGVPHAKIGRRTVVRLDRLLEVHDRLSGAEPRRPSAAWDEDTIVAMAARPRARRGAS